VEYFALHSLATARQELAESVAAYGLIDLSAEAFKRCSLVFLIFVILMLDA
jgi:hypothetical protein